MQFVLLLVCFLKSQSTHAGLRIYGGREAYENEFPFVVAITYEVKTKDEHVQEHINYRIVCTCALISPTWCLTAAHCNFLESNNEFKTLPPQKKLVLTNQDLSKVSEVTWAVNHPYYKGLDPAGGILYPHNDIGLVRSEPMVLEQYAKLSAVEYTTLMGFEVTSVGYVRNQSDNIHTSLYFNTSLKVLKTVIVPCPEKMRNVRGMCLSHVCGEVGVICGGDSGSPLVHTSGVIGVTSLGHSKCRLPEYYNEALASRGISSEVIVAISPHIDWISNIITKHDHTKT